MHTCPTDSVCVFHYDTSLTVIKTHQLRYQLAQFKRLHLLLAFRQEFYLLDHMREIKPSSLPNTAAVNSYVTEAALCQLFLVKDP